MTTSTAVQDFAATYREVSDGVVRIWATTCDGQGTGTGFLVDRHTVATALDVVDGAAAVAVETDQSTRSATVVGVDRANDLALLRITSDVDGHVFAFADRTPRPFPGSRRSVTPWNCRRP